jgi:exodeoxyribonuclease-5
MLAPLLPWQSPTLFDLSKVWEQANASQREALFDFAYKLVTGDPLLPVSLQASPQPSPTAQSGLAAPPQPAPQPSTQPSTLPLSPQSQQLARVPAVVKRDDEFVLKGDQVAAWELILKFLAGNEKFFALRGYAGTGKSFLLKSLKKLPQHNFIFSATTNKAAAVLSSFIGEPAKTVYSVLGLRMEQDDDKLVLTAGKRRQNLGDKPILIIDEAGMAPQEVVRLLVEAVNTTDLRVILVGDPAQLNPVGEVSSQAWRLPSPACRITMKQPLRFDNDLLTVATGVRTALRKKSFDYDFVTSANVEVLRKSSWMESILSIRDWDANKVACWRNKTVNKINEAVREGLGYEDRFVPGENILMAAPLVSDDTILAHTDEEFKVASVGERRFSLPEGELDAWVLTLVDKDFPIFVPQSGAAFQEALSKRASLASKQVGKRRKELWSHFWDLKNLMQDVRYGYAMTTHRLQGTTVNNVYVDRQDILANPNPKEGYRCLYVATTRASNSLKIL